MVQTRVGIVLCISFATALLPSTLIAADIRASFVESCPTAKPEVVVTGGVVSAILVAFAGSLVDAGIAAAKKLVNPDAKSVSGKFLQENLYTIAIQPDPGPLVVKLNGELRCLVIAVAESGPDANWILPFEPEQGQTKEDAQKIIADKLGLTAPPIIYVEAYLQQSTDNTAVVWRVRRFYVGGYLNESFWAGRTRAYRIEMKMYSPGDSTPFLSQSYDFPFVRKPFDPLVPKPSSEPRGPISGEWGKLPNPPAESAENLTQVKKLLDDGTFDMDLVVVEGKLKSGETKEKVEAVKKLMPYTLEVQIVETPKPYQIALAFVDAVESQSPAIKDWLKQRIDNGAAATAQLATVEAINNYVKAVGETTVACANGATLACELARDNEKILLGQAKLACAQASVDSCARVRAL